MATWTKEVVDLSVAGDSLQIDDIVIQDNYIGHVNDSDLLEFSSGRLTVNGHITLNGDIGLLSGTTSIGIGIIRESLTFFDNVELNIGTSDDTVIVHDESNTTVTHSGTGTLKMNKLHLESGGATSTLNISGSSYIEGGSNKLILNPHSSSAGICQILSGGETTLQIRGTSADAEIQFLDASSVKWSLGIDQSDSHIFKIQNATGASTVSTAPCRLELIPSEGAKIVSYLTTHSVLDDSKKVKMLELYNRHIEGSDANPTEGMSSDINFYMDWDADESKRDKLSGRIRCQFLGSMPSKEKMDMSFSTVGLGATPSDENAIRETLRLTHGGDVQVTDGDLYIGNRGDYPGGGALILGGLISTPSNSHTDGTWNDESFTGSPNVVAKFAEQLVPWKLKRIDSTYIDSGTAYHGFDFPAWHKVAYAGHGHLGDNWDQDVYQDPLTFDEWAVKPAFFSNQNIEFKGKMTAAGDHPAMCRADANGDYITELTTSTTGNPYDTPGSQLTGVPDSDVFHGSHLIHHHCLLSSIRVAVLKTNSDGTGHIEVSVIEKKAGDLDGAVQYVRGYAELTAVQNRWSTNTKYTNIVENAYNESSLHDKLDTIHFEPGSLVYIVISTNHTDDVLDFKVSLEFVPVTYGGGTAP